MNHTYRLVWNEDAQRYAPACESARSCGKSARTGKALRSIAVVLGSALALPGFAQSLSSKALPTGGEVVAGKAGIAQKGSQMTITQSSDKAILNWQSFNIGKSASVQFLQHKNTDVALNRVVAGNASQIQGRLVANGQVWLVNPNGIVFGKTSQIDVGGLVASTLGTTDKDFLAGKAVFTRNGATGAIVNQGAITAAEGGQIALLAPSVRNDGILTAQLGSVTLAAGDRITLKAGADGLLQVAVDPATMRTLVENKQLIVADGGQVVMTGKAADALSSSVVANTGTVQANRLAKKDGRILLLADMAHGQVQASGTLQARFVETSAAAVEMGKNLKVETAGGEWLIDPLDITIDSTKAAALQKSLQTGDVTVTTAGTGADKGDINVNANISYSKKKLTLNADNNINLNAVISVKGSAKLAMNYGGTDGSVNKKPVAGSKINTAFKEKGGFAGRVDFEKQGTGLLSINGEAYTVIKDITALQNIHEQVWDSKNYKYIKENKYALGGNIDAKATADWVDKNGTGKGFAPIDVYFTGTVDGLGHTVSNLTIKRSGSSNIGLFSRLKNGSEIRNLGLVNAKVAGGNYTGAFVGFNESGSIVNVYATGTVTGEGGYSYVGSYVGGLIGYNDSGVISNAYSKNTVKGVNDVGGLVGYSRYGRIQSVYATGTVKGTDYVGGLVGENDRTTIADSHASGAVSGGKAIGGLVGENDSGVVRNSYASGIVKGKSSVGGLVGQNYSSGSIVSNASATGAVIGTDNYVGGLIGRNNGTVNNASASGNVKAVSQVGGLVGWSNGFMTAVSASGSVTGDNEAGGLVGVNDGSASVVKASASGAVKGNGYVTGNSYLGGLVGRNYGVVTDAHASGAVTSGTYVSSTSSLGGLIGYNSGIVIDTYATGAVTGKVNGYAGGLIGYQSSGGLIDDSHALGTVKGKGQVGGLVGESYSYYTNITRSYFATTDAKGKMNGNKDNGYGVAKTLKQLKQDGIVE